MIIWSNNYENFWFIYFTIHFWFICRLNGIVPISSIVLSEAFELEDKKKRQEKDERKLKWNALAIDRIWIGGAGWSSECYWHVSNELTWTQTHTQTQIQTQRALPGTKNRTEILRYWDAEILERCDLFFVVGMELASWWTGHWSVAKERQHATPRTSNYSTARQLNNSETLFPSSLDVFWNSRRLSSIIVYFVDSFKIHHLINLSVIIVVMQAYRQLIEFNSLFKKN